MDATEKGEDLVAQTWRLLGTLAAPVLAPFLAEWPQTTERRAVASSALPVLRWLPELVRDAPSFSTALVGALHQAAPSLAWRQTYTVREVGARFLDCYGWSEIAGESGPLPSKRIACGYLLLGPDTHYPRHRHEAEEIYLPLAGTAAWQQGDGLWRDRSPGTLIYHVGDEAHAMRTGEHPLLALYLWRSAHLSQKARFDASQID
jgi:hypothetical protein